MEIARSYFITLNLLYGKLFHTHFVQLCQGTTVVDGGSGSGSHHGRGGSGSYKMAAATFTTVVVRTAATTTAVTDSP